MKQEPVIFNYKASDDETIPASLRDLDMITLLINPERLDLNWRKVISRIRTKSRIVSLFWGQEPVNFSYTGQTGNIHPTSTELTKGVDSINTANEDQLNLLQENQQIVDGELSQVNKGLTNAAVNSPTEFSLLQERASLEAELATNQQGIDATSPVNPDTFTQTEMYELSAKYQRFKSLHQLFENSRNIKDLMKVKYRDYIFEGYFESFGFIDSGSDPWNRSYKLSFTILGWSKPFTPSTNEIILVKE